ncbi:MAG: hypothetical protein RH948_15705 [Cyclobacteriaceae bacterium]
MNSKFGTNMPRLDQFVAIKAQIRSDFALAWFFQHAFEKVNI